MEKNLLAKLGKTPMMSCRILIPVFRLEGGVHKLVYNRLSPTQVIALAVLVHLLIYHGIYNILVEIVHLVN